VDLVSAEHLWTFALAFATYMILIYVSPGDKAKIARIFTEGLLVIPLLQPLHPVTRHLERSWWMFFIVIYVLSFALSLVTYFIYGFWPGKSGRPSVCVMDCLT
jgi:hypothetical protein